MKSTDSRVYEMLLRVRDFGKTHRDAFPESSPGGLVFDELATVVARVDQHPLTRRSAGASSKDATRAALVGALADIGRCARVIAAHTPGFEGAFRPPRARVPQALLRHARLVAQEAEPHRRVFVAHGLAESFVQDLVAAADAFERAAQVREVARTKHAAARAGVEAGMTEAMALVRKLDIFVATKCKHDAVVLAAWARDRKVERHRTKRLRSATSTGERAGTAAPAPAVPGAPSAAPPVVAPSVVQLAAVPPVSSSTARADLPATRLQEVA